MPPNDPASMIDVEFKLYTTKPHKLSTLKYDVLIQYQNDVVLRFLSSPNSVLTNVKAKVPPGLYGIYASVTGESGIELRIAVNGYDVFMEKLPSSGHYEKSKVFAIAPTS